MSKAHRRILALSVGLFLFSSYLLIYRGGFHSVDEVSIFAVTESLVKFGRFDTNQIAWTQWTTTQAEAQGFFGVDGNVYSKKGLALSLAQAPLYALAMLLPNVGMLQAVSLLNALITAATGLLLFMFLERLGYTPRVAAITALIFGLATISFVYAKYLFSEPLAGFLLLLAAYMLYVYRIEGGLHHLLIAGLAAGFAVLTRANNLFLLPVFGLYLLYIVANREWRVIDVIKPLAVFVGSVLIVGLLLLGYNALRAGNPFQTGYDLTLFTPNVLLGLYKLLFSPLRGLFIYSPILLLSLPGWWLLHRRRPAEAWLCVGLVGVTVGLFSAWSSGEGLSWGSRFLVPVVPFFLIALAPIVDDLRSRGWRLAMAILLPLSLVIQLLGAAMNPWVFLSKLQTDFGGEFFLENTAALYDFRYSQIVGQVQMWSLQNSDVAWWQPWGFDALAFGLSLALWLGTGWLLWQAIQARRLSLAVLLLPMLLAVGVSYIVLTRYYQSDLQFGAPNDAYTQSLEAIAAEGSDGPILTVAQYNYHVPMNRFAARVPIIGFAQATPPLPTTAAPLLQPNNDTIWLVTLGFPPAAPDNATEQWLSRNAFNLNAIWYGESVRQLRYTHRQPTATRAIDTTLGDSLRLVAVDLNEAAQAGEALPVALHWQAETPPQADYNLFLQLLNAEGALITQHDSPPDGGYVPTSAWQAGERITMRHGLLLPSEMAPGDYRLIAGLYDPQTGERLPVDSGGDFVDLGVITVPPIP